jgi:hypothetical protein
MLRADPWKGEDAAAAMAEVLRERGKEHHDQASSGDELSAISLSYKSHKGPDGVHSIDAAKVLHGISINPGRTRIVQARRKTEVWIKRNASFVSVNPSVESWKVFVSDIKKQINDRTSQFSAMEARGVDKRDAARQFIEDMEADMESAGISAEEYLTFELGYQITQCVLASATRAYKNGRHAVATAMDKSEDGTESGRSTALSDLDTVFRTSWAPFWRPVGA